MGLLEVRHLMEVLSKTCFYQIFCSFTNFEPTSGKLQLIQVHSRKLRVKIVTKWGTGECVAWELDSYIRMTSDQTRSLIQMISDHGEDITQIFVHFSCRANSVILKFGIMKLKLKLFMDLISDLGLVGQLWILGRLTLLFKLKHIKSKILSAPAILQAPISY